MKVLVVEPGYASYAAESEVLTPLGAQIKRWVRICGFMGSGDGATFWRVRTFRRDENIALETARLCVAELARMGWKEAA